MPPSQPNCIVRGSINNDEYFQVDHIARPGETLSSSGHASRIGGKGANQAAAIARAGGSVKLVGAIGKDGLWLREKMREEGVNVGGLVLDEDVPTGRAIIQVDKHGENSIILFPGANHSLLPDQNPSTELDACTHLLLQNEIQMRSTLAALSATSPHTTVILNPSPLPTKDEIQAFPWARINWLIVNQSEAAELCQALAVDVLVRPSTGTNTGKDEDPRELVEALGNAPPLGKTNVVCTLGADGVVCRLSDAHWESGKNQQESKLIYVPAAELQGDVRDTTGAGDCFAGYFVKGLMDLEKGKGKGADVAVVDVEGILRVCVVAAGMCVEKRGTIDSVPTHDQVAVRLGASASSA